MSGGTNNKSEVLGQVYKLVNEGHSERTAVIAVAQARGLKPQTVQTYVSEARRFAKSEVEVKVDPLEPTPIEAPTDDLVLKRDPDLDLKLDLQKARQEARMWRKKAEDYRDQHKQQDEFLTALAGMMPRMPLVTPPRVVKSGKGGEALAVADWSDWHVFRTVSLSETEGMYEYNFEIFCSLFWDLLQKTVKIIEIQRGEHTIRKLWIVLGGDMLNDEHRDENIFANEVWNALGVYKLTSVVVQGLRWMLNFVDEIDIDAVVGNEPRMTKEKTAKFQYRNWDWVFYHSIRIAMKDEILAGRVKMFVPLSPDIVVEQMGFNWLITHGDKAKSWNGIPYYGINRYVMKQHDLRRAHKLFNPNGRDFYYVLMHDKHTMSDLNHHTVFVNGALCGTDEYAKNVLSVGGPRMQRLMFVNEKYGPFCQYPLMPFPDGGHPFELDDDHNFVEAMSHEIPADSK